MNVRAYVAALICSCGEMCIGQTDKKAAEIYLKSSYTSDDFQQLLSREDKLRFARFLLDHYAHNIKKAVGGFVDDKKSLQWN